MAPALKLTNQQFGKLTVLQQAKSRNNQTWWHCLCACGTSTLVSGVHLKTGNTKSCGCLRNQDRTLPTGVARLRAHFSTYRHSARIRKHTFSLSFEQFMDLVQKPCHYCGQEPQLLPLVPRQNGTSRANGIDRKDNSIGYTLDNSLPCCSVCNHAKHTMDYTMFMDWLGRVAVFQQFKVV